LFADRKAEGGIYRDPPGVTMLKYKRRVRYIRKEKKKIDKKNLPQKCFELK
jgi:hypothetical protein